MNIPPAVAVAIITILASLLLMGGEAILSSFNERQLRSRGAIEPEGDVIDAMRFAYPGAFLAMGIEGALTGPAPATLLLAGLALFGIAKALKIWAISSLGGRWSYRVLILPGVPLVTTGPYRFIPHPNYVAVAGEIVSVAMIVWAPVTGTLSAVGFGWLMIQRMKIEDRALGRSTK
ncbi:MAG: isoprenylcysteine carboxylmethyltransferase family protein [Vicinamibacterales bacterium]